MGINFYIIYCVSQHEKHNQSTSSCYESLTVLILAFITNMILTYILAINMQKKSFSKGFKQKVLLLMMILNFCLMIWEGITVDDDEVLYNIYSRFPFLL